MKIILFFLAISTFSACGKNHKNGEALELKADLVNVITEKNDNPNLSQPPPPPKEEVQENNPLNKFPEISKKIIKNGEMAITVAKISEAKKQVEKILKKTNAYTQSETFQNSDTSEDLDLIIRVPYQNFDALVNSFSNGIGTVDFKTIKANDVTEEYTEVSIKLTNKKIYLDKYRVLLKNASSTKDMLEIQENIRGLEDEIDVAEGRLRFIDDKVNFSTLNLSLHKEKIRSSSTGKIGFGSSFVDSIAEGWNTFVAFLLGVISLWPFFLLIPIAILIWKRWKRRK